MMRKALKRVLDRLRAKTNVSIGPKSSVRGGLQEPQRMRLHPAPARVRA